MSITKRKQVWLSRLLIISPIALGLFIVLVSNFSNQIYTLVISGISLTGSFLISHQLERFKKDVCKTNKI